jgi:hypothetical protein
MIETLQNLIIPALPSPYLKGQALSIVGILNNLVGKVEEDHRIYARRNALLSETLKEIVNYLRTGEKIEIPKQIEDLCQKILDQLDRQFDDRDILHKEKYRELNGLIEELLMILEEQKEFLRPNTREDILKLIRQQLRQQLDEDLKRLNICEMGELFKH